MQVLRTPEERFTNLPGYLFAPRYVEIDGLRMHYVDEGPPDAAPVLMLHGEPSWSYLYRHMIPPIASAGHRAIAPDLFGFGRSDKPARVGDYSYQRHVDWVAAFLAELNLTGITLVCQDWGSLIGLRLVAEQAQRFDRVVLANGGLPTGDQKLPRVFYVWRGFARWSPWFPIGKIIDKGTTTRLDGDVIAAYDAPFPDRRYKAGARAFPRLVPATPGDPAAEANRTAWEVLGRWEKPFLTAFSDRDPITRGADRPMTEHIPGARGQPHTVIRGGGHFLQEDRGPELARVVIDFIAGGR
jgi:haloalkane dehalogenase